ncbi:MAG: hypothetical protein EBT03_11520 [Betaproteobacteria bacterium]|nr:hypothetical protein [Betaproteobacteria bacterium]
MDQDGEELTLADTQDIVISVLKCFLTKRSKRAVLTPKEFLAYADEEANHFARRQVTQYTLCTRLSVKSLPQKAFTVRGCTVAAIKNLKRFALPSALTQIPAESSLRGHLSATRYLPVAVKTEGRSVHEATSRALGAIDLLRGLWTIKATSGRFLLVEDAHKRRSISAVRSAPIHTLHHRDGRVAYENYWHDPSYAGDADLFVPKEGWSRVERYRRLAMLRMASSKYRKEVEDLVIRYANALDYTSPDMCFLHLWSLLEKITGTVGGKYDDTIKRTACVFADAPRVKEVLGFLRMLRNRFVHASVGSEGRCNIAYTLKYFVDIHLNHLISNTFRLDALGQYADLLDLPANYSVLQGRRFLLSKAIRLHSPATN